MVVTACCKINMGLISSVLKPWCYFVLDIHWQPHQSNTHLKYAQIEPKVRSISIEIEMVRMVNTSFELDLP